jgi:hypothetical protein
VRNALNAETIERMAKEFPAGTIVLYFAHDEHVALSCEGMRRDEYATEGSLLRMSMGLRYRSSGTYAPSLWSHWGYKVLGYKKTPRLTAETDETTKRYCATAKREVFMMPKRRGGAYKPADFDYVLCDTRRNAFGLNWMQTPADVASGAPACRGGGGAMTRGSPSRAWTCTSGR